MSTANNNFDIDDVENEVTSETAIKFIRTANGDDIISEIMELTDKDEFKDLLLINPMKIFYMLGEAPNSFSISLGQWVFHSVCDEQTFQINTSEIMLVGEPTENMIEYYQSTLEQMNRVEKIEQKERNTKQDIEQLMQAATNDKTEEEMNELKNKLANMYKPGTTYH